MKKKGKTVSGGLSIAVFALALFLPAMAVAGSLDTTGAPAHTMMTIDQLYEKLVKICLALTTSDSDCYFNGDGICDTGESNCPAGDIAPAALQKGSLTPPATIASTMKTLEQSYKKLVKICEKATGSPNCAYTLNDGVCDTDLGECAAPDCAAACECTNGVCDTNETYATCPADCPRFTSLSATEITDNSTGLIWIKSPDSTTRSWNQSNAYCPTIGASWRLSSVTELLGLISGWSGASPAAWLMTKGFTNVTSNIYWTSTESDIIYHECVDMRDGNYWPDYDSNYFTWCVR